MEYINRYQPVRPRHNPQSGKVLLFRTRPKWQRKMIMLHTFANQICAMRLYRAVRRGEVPQQVAIHDLHNWIANDGAFSKVTLGFIVVNSLAYEPRKLVANQSVEKATSTYCFLDPDLKDLEFGLEWIICTFYRKFMNKISEADLQITDQTTMAQELDQLASMSEEEYAELEEDIAEFMMPPIDWNQISLEAGWDFREELPEPLKPQEPKRPRTLPRDLSKPT